MKRTYYLYLGATRYPNNEAECKYFLEKIGVKVKYNENEEKYIKENKERLDNGSNYYFGYLNFYNEYQIKKLIHDDVLFDELTSEFRRWQEIDRFYPLIKITVNWTTKMLLEYDLKELVKCYLYNQIREYDDEFNRLVYDVESSSSYKDKIGKDAYNILINNVKFELSELLVLKSYKRIAEEELEKLNSETNDDDENTETVSEEINKEKDILKPSSIFLRC